MNTMKYPAILLLATALLGGTVDAQHFEHKEHHLGPTGLFGVTSPADIKITKVEAGSPADGKIKVGDVIVAAGGTPFKEITRRQLADAIDQAETGQAKGVLTLTLKDGRKVDLQLKVLGSYSDTAPLPLPQDRCDHHRCRRLPGQVEEVRPRGHEHRPARAAGNRRTRIRRCGQGCHPQQPLGEP